MLFKPKSFRAFLRAVHPKKWRLRGFLSFLILAREKKVPLETVVTGRQKNRRNCRSSGHFTG